MPDVRYSVPGVPPGPAAGLSAFLPHFNRPAASGAQSYKYAVGVIQRAPAPTRDTAPSPDVGDLANVGTSRSTDAPDSYWPQKYYQGFIAEPPGAGMPVQRYDTVRPGLTTVLPVPALNPAGTLRRDSAVLARQAILNRVRQLPWFPRVYRAPNA